MNNKLSENLKKIRKENNLSQEQLAEKMGVSRQSISKWESDQAYPEMEKIIQLCSMFNLNIDDLLNNDINEVRGEQESKNNINRYINDFLDFIANTVNMFCSMSIKSKIKCLFEQLIIAFILTAVFLLGNFLCNRILSGIFSGFRIKYSSSLFDSLYTAAAAVISAVVIIHIFTIRYLNYYKKTGASGKTNTIPETESRSNSDKPFELRRSRQIIIRDAKDGKYSFLNGVLKCAAGFFKLILIFVSLFLCFLLVCCTGGIVFSFAAVKTGLFFAGTLLAMLALTCIAAVVLLAVMNFVFNRKNNKKQMIWTFLCSVAALGLGLGTASLGFTRFETVNIKTDPMYELESSVFEMSDELAIYTYYEPVVFVADSRDDIKIEYIKNKNLDIYLERRENGIYRISKANGFDIFKNSLKQFNNKKIDFTGDRLIDIKVYASEENIEKLKSNFSKTRES